MKPTRLSEAIVNRNFLLLGSGEVTSRVLAFFALIYIARKLGAEAYGVIGFASAIIIYFNRITDFGIETLGPKEVAQDPRQIGDLAASVIGARLLIATILAAGIGLTGTYLMPQPDGVVLAYYGLTLFAVGGSVRWIHLGLERAMPVSLSRIAAEIIKLLIIILFIQQASDVLKVPIAQVVGDTLGAILLILWLRRSGAHLKLRLKWSIALSVFKKSWPLMVTPILGLIIYNSDLIFLRYFRSSGEVGYYLAAYVLITFVANIATTYSASLLPTLTRLGRAVKNHQHDLYHNSMAQVFVLGFPIAVGGYFLATKVIKFWFGSDFIASGMILQILIWSVPLLLMRNVIQTVLVSRGRQDRILQLTTFVAVFNIAINFILIPQYGMIGAAITTVLSEAVRLGLCQYFAIKEGFEVTSFSRFWKSIIASAAMFIVLFFISQLSLWISLIAGIIVYFITLAISGGISFKRGKLPSITV